MTAIINGFYFGHGRQFAMVAVSSHCQSAIFVAVIKDNKLVIKADDDERCERGRQSMTIIEEKKRRPWQRKVRGKNSK